MANQYIEVWVGWNFSNWRDFLFKPFFGRLWKYQ